MPELYPELDSRQGAALQRVFCLPSVNKQGRAAMPGLDSVCVLSSWQNISIQVWAVQVRWLDCDRHPTWPPDTIHSKLSEVCAKEIHGSSSSNQNIKKCKFCYLQHSTFSGSVDLWELLKLKITFCGIFIKVISLRHCQENEISVITEPWGWEWAYHKQILGELETKGGQIWLNHNRWS